MASQGDGEQSTLACLRLRGLPFTATHSQLLDWFEGYTIIDALITRSYGKPNGQAFVLLPKKEAIKAQVELNNKYMGKRFIEVFSSTIADMETASRLSAEQQKASGSGGGSSQRSRQSPNNLHIIRLRGLPFSATPADVKAFLAPIVLPDGINSIQMARHADLRPTGEAYVHLSTEKEVMQALNKHKQMMGKRYIEVFPSCLAELQQSMTPPCPIGFQQADQGFGQSPVSVGGDVAQLNMFGPGPMPVGSPAAQAAWLQRQQQLQHAQLCAAAQQKMLANLQQQRQAASLRMHAQLQAQAQVLPSMLQQMQLQDTACGSQQPQPDVLVTVPGLPLLNTPQGQQQQQQQQHLLFLNGLSTPMLSVPAAASVNSSAMSLASSATTGTASAASGSLLSSNMASTLSGFNAAGYAAMGGMAPGGLAASAAAAATATSTPSALDVQYVPFFCSGHAAPAAALALQDRLAWQSGGPQVMSLNCQTGLSGLGSSSNAAQQLVLAAELLGSSANALDGAAMAGSSGAAGTALP